MFERVLIPTDFSKYAKKTLKCIANIPGIGAVVLLHVVDATHYNRSGWTHEPEIENAKIHLHEEKKFLEELGVTASMRLEVITGGDIASSIIHAAKEERVSTIIMGSRGRGLIKGILLGSASSGVLRRGQTHQMILRDSVTNVLTEDLLIKNCRGLFSRVLCPTDFSPPSQVALESLSRLPGLGDIFLLHVITKGESKAEIEQEVNDATAHLEKIQQDLAEKKIRAQIRIRLGRPTDEITRLAEEEDISLILMSSRGMGWIRDLLIGSTTHGVAIHSQRPVMVVRASLPDCN
jgi:nucleotide-binding universal stress UspA family protein